MTNTSIKSLFRHFEIYMHDIIKSSEFIYSTFLLKKSEEYLSCINEYCDSDTLMDMGYF